MSDAARLEQDRVVYEVVRYVEAPADLIRRFLGALEMCGYVLRAPAPMPEGGAEPVAWGMVAANTGKMCNVTMEHADVEDLRPEHVIPLYDATALQDARRQGREDACTLLTARMSAILDRHADVEPDTNAVIFGDGWESIYEELEEMRDDIRALPGAK